MTTQTTQFVGQRIRRTDAVPRLTGAERYTDDVQLPGLLHAHLVTSPHGHARLVGIDTTTALSVPGVTAVITAADLPPFARNDDSESRMDFFLANEFVRYVGQPVAVVLANSIDAAFDGASLVDVQYKPMSAVVFGENALAAEATNVRPDRADGSNQHPNLSGEVRFERGDVEQAFSDAAVTVERTFYCHSVHQGYMEPRSATAAPNRDGTLTIWTATQGQFMVRAAVAKALGMEESAIDIQPLTVGGGFGGRFMLIESLVGLLAQIQNRPVKLTLTRAQDFAGTTPTPEKSFTLALAADEQGNLTGLKGDLIFNTGYFSKSPYQQATLLLGSNYKVSSLSIVAREVFSHRSGTGSYRAPGLPHMAFALEQLVDEIARRLEIDPIDFRQKNAAGGGDVMADNEEIWQPFEMGPMLERIRESAIWRDPKNPNQGVGVAIGGRRGATDAAQATARLTGDGRIEITVGSIDLTGTTTGLVQITAEILGISPETISVATAPAQNAPYAGGTGGSKILYTVGNAVIEASSNVREQILSIAAEELEAGPADLELTDDRVKVRGSDDHYLTLKQIYQQTIGTNPKHSPVCGNGDQENAIKASAMGAAAARVTVDPETGEVTVDDILIVQDVGRAINPAEVEGQIHGGAIQSVGIGLYEGLVFDNGGQLLSGTFMDYALPRTTQAPKIDTVLVEDPAPHGPFGARGVAETPIVLPVAAIANAIFDATGVRLQELPMRSEHIWRAIQNARQTIDG